MCSFVSILTGGVDCELSLGEMERMHGMKNKRVRAGVQEKGCKWSASRDLEQGKTVGLAGEGGGG